MDRNNITDSSSNAELQFFFQSILSSPTITARFNVVHIILALFDFAQNPKGIGRYALRKGLNIGEGMARSIVEKFKAKNLIIRKSTRRGHILTSQGNLILRLIQAQIPYCGSAPDICGKIVVKGVPFICLVRDHADKLGSGIEARDAAIKIGGYGATCLVVGDGQLHFPQDKVLVDGEIQESLAKLLPLEERDIIIIGAGGNKIAARLAAMNAALSLTDFIPAGGF